MSEQTSMEEILAVNSDVEPPKTEEKPEPKEEAATPEPEAKDDSADAVETEAKAAEADKAEDKTAKADTVPHEALHAEREKRKAIEQRFNSLQDQVNALLPHLAKGQDGAKPKAQEAPAVSFSEDPEGFITGKLTQIEQHARQEAATRFFDMSEASAKRRHGAEAYEAAFDWFKQAASAEPALIQKLNEQPDPAEWIMSTYNKAGEVAKVSDPNYWANREKELREKWEAEQAEAAEQAAQEAATTVPQPRKSLAKARSVKSGRTGKAQFTGPTPIDDILPGR